MGPSGRLRMASLPPRQSLESTNAGGRPRVSHLVREYRIIPYTAPKGLPGSLAASTSSEEIDIPIEAFSSGNAAFQALLNIPIFIDFVRIHSKKRCKITDCLTCAFAQLASFYWLKDLDDVHRPLFLQKHETLWQHCLKKVLAKAKIRQGQSLGALGDREFYTESILLNLLAEMQHQLEKYPSDYQTFHRLFTSHIARRWKCKFRHCGHENFPHYWESALYLPINVQRSGRGENQTTVIEGLNKGLQQWTQDIAGLCISHPELRKCEECNQDAEAYNEIVDLPEILILVRDISELDSRRNTPYIPYLETMNLELQTAPQLRRTTATYTLVSGTAEHRQGRGGDYQSMAIVRDSSNSNYWYGLRDEEGFWRGTLDDLDRHQRLSSVRNLPEYVFPEVFIYQRTDGNGLRDYGQTQPVRTQALSPLIPNTNYLIRNTLASSVTDIFTQKIGDGLLKFRLDMTPAEPEPSQVVDFTLSIGYEVDDHHWGVKIEDKLHPVSSESAYVGPLITPAFGSHPVSKYMMRQSGKSPSQFRAPPLAIPTNGESNEMELDSPVRFANIPLGKLKANFETCLQSINEIQGGRKNRRNNNSNNHHHHNQNNNHQNSQSNQNPTGNGGDHHNSGHGGFGSGRGHRGGFRARRGRRGNLRGRNDRNNN